MSSEKPDLNLIVHTQFRELFGEPQKTEGQGEHWSLLPSAGAVRINVMVNGSRQGAAIWIFDPHDPQNSVVSAAITAEHQIDELIGQLHERVKRAALPRLPALPTV